MQNRKRSDGLTGSDLIVQFHTEGGECARHRSAHIQDLAADLCIISTVVVVVVVDPVGYSAPDSCESKENEQWYQNYSSHRVTLL